MSMPILATKLYAPPLRAHTISRSHLVQQLHEGLHQPHGFGRKLTLVSAPAGFGKTTLLSEWLTDREQPVAWLSLDAADNDLTRFLLYFISALQKMAPELGAGVLSALQSPQPAPVEAILTVLLNEITAVSDPILLVLDDYHVIHTASIDDTLAFLLEHLPPQMHLVMATREDPPFPLSRYRARGQLAELRAADLRFTTAEAAAFLNQTMGLSLSGAEVAALEARTEGWITGLQMAALSMQGRADSARFIQAFTGSHRFILDYLLEEVLQRQPEQVRTFLLQTAVLDRLCGSLCDAVTGQADGKETLEALKRGNLFVVPLDDERQWYRYHHLFAEVLQVRTLEDQPEQVTDLHQRASGWYAQHGFAAEAIHHALAAKDYQRAATLLETDARPTRRSSPESAWRSWVQALPDEIVYRRPVLSVYYALALLPAALDTAETYLGNAEQWLIKSNTELDASLAEMIVVEAAEFRSLPGTICVARAYRAGALGDLPGIRQYARQALALLPQDDHLWRGAAAALLGLAHWHSGDLEAAYQAIAEGAASLQTSGDQSSVMGARFLLADIRFAQGRLQEAFRISEQALRLAAEQETAVIQGTADLHVMLAEIYIEQNKLDAAREQLVRSEELGDLAGLPEMRHRWHTAMARIKETQGDSDGALACLDEAEHLYIGGPAPDVRPIAALKVRLWLRQGRLKEALAWVQAQNLSVDGEFHYLNEYALITLARVLLAKFQSDRSGAALQNAMQLLARLRQAAEEGGRLGSLIEILILQALNHKTQGDFPAAYKPLKRAVSLAEPEGFVRVFVDEGQPMANLLAQMKNEAGGAGELFAPLLAGFSGTQGAQFSARVHQPLLEPLSERELDVLRLLATDLSGPEIASELMVSLNTMRTHTKNIYTKLGVNNRRTAVSRAQEFHLL